MQESVLILYLVELSANFFLRKCGHHRENRRDSHGLILAEQPNSANVISAYFLSNVKRPLCFNQQIVGLNVGLDVNVP